MYLINEINVEIIIIIINKCFKITFKNFIYTNESCIIIKIYLYIEIEKFISLKMLFYY